MWSRRGGFTIIELLAVLAILSVLSCAVFPIATMQAERARERDLRAALRTIRDAIDAYKKLSDAGQVSGPAAGYPPTLQTLVEGVVRSSDNQRIYLLRGIPRDPFDQTSVDDASTWALRSFQSPADHPEPGDDIYDVHSKSNAVALDGSKVSTW